MILDVEGRPVTKTTETAFDPRLVEMLIALSDLLNQNGLGLFCMRCHRLGNNDGVKADNKAGSDTYRLSCGCATRVFNRKTGQERVLVS